MRVLVVSGGVVEMTLLSPGGVQFIEELQEMRKNGTIIESTEYQVSRGAGQT